MAWEQIGVRFCQQRLRRLSEPLESWKRQPMLLATELALERIDRAAAVLPFPLQDTQCDQAACQVMPLSPLSTRLTAIEPAGQEDGVRSCNPT